jgi:D-alanine-D-alanine ligase
MKTVLILCGGRSAEHEISLISAKGILGALDRSRYTPCLVGVAKDGTWYSQDESSYYTGELRADQIRLNENRPRVTLAPYLHSQKKGLLQVEKGNSIEFDAVFPILHGQYGEDGTLQGMLDVIGIPYVGSRCGASWVCMDKSLTKMVCEKNGIPVGPYLVLRSVEEMHERLAEIERFTFPVFVKPSCQGSSVGITKVKNREGLQAAVEKALSFDRLCLVEKAIVGREIECAVLGLKASPRASLPGEILVSSKAEWYSYEAKYLGGDLAKTQTPADLSPELTKEVQRLAEKTFQVLECDGLARIDMLLETASGKLYLNEPNTLPGFTPISMYPQMWEASGLPYSQLISELIELAFARNKQT